MNFFKNLSVRKKIFTIAVFFSIIASFIYTFSIIESGILNDKLVATQINLSLLDARNLEKDFIKYKKIELSDSHKIIKKEFDSLLTALSDDEKYTSKLENLRVYYASYDSLFNVFVEKSILRGLSEEEGIEGALRSAVRDIEDALKEENAPSNIMISMLMCRRSEKDYLMRGAQKYVDRVNTYSKEMKSSISDLQIDSDIKDNLNLFADSYIEKFNDLVRIKADMDQLVIEMDSEASQIEPLVNLLVEEHKADAEFYSSLQMVVSLLSIFFGLYVANKISKFIADPIEELELITKEISSNPEGDHFIDIDSEDEIGELAYSINSMVDQIKDAMLIGKTEGDRVRKELEEQIAEQTVTMQTEHDYLENAINACLNGMDKFSNGNLTIELPVENVSGSIKELYTGFNKAILNVRQMIIEIIDMVDTTSAAATQISVSAEQLHSGSRQQVDQSLSINAAVEEMSQTINHNAENATKTSSVANENGSVAKDGRTVVQSAAKKIQDIAHTVTDSLKNIETLGESANGISKIVNVIKDISSQTNLLALNAAIEAASAGEMGRGFSVVAEEVRKLAERTTTATGEITVMINKIQTETEAVVSKMKHGYQEVDEGLELANKADTALVKIVDSSTDVESLVKEIAVANTEQATASDDISKNIEGISNLSREASNGIEQISQACDGLHKQTERLQLTVQKFAL